MSLLADLRNLARSTDVQFVPSTNEVQSVLGALVHYTEHGDKILKAAEEGIEDVQEILAPKPEEHQAQDVSSSSSPAVPPAPAASAPVSPAAGESSSSDTETDADLERQIADLESRLAARRATSQQTVVEHQEGASVEAPAAVPPVEPIV